MLGLELAPRAHLLALYDPRADRWLPTPREAEVARREAEDARRAAENEVARLRAELDRLRGTDA